MFYTVNVSGAKIATRFQWTRDYHKAQDERARILRYAEERGINLPCGVQVFGHENKYTVLKADVSNWADLGCIIVGTGAMEWIDGAWHSAQYRGGKWVAADQQWA